MNVPYPNANNTVTDTQAYLETVWARAIARAWTDPEYKRALLDRSSVHKALEAVGWEFEATVALEVEVVEAPPEQVWTGVGSGDDTGWDRARPTHKITLSLPRPPADAALQPLALSEYVYYFSKTNLAVHTCT